MADVIKNLESSAFAVAAGVEADDVPHLRPVPRLAMLLPRRVVRHPVHNRHQPAHLHSVVRLSTIDRSFSCLILALYLVYEDLPLGSISE